MTRLACTSLAPAILAATTLGLSWSPDGGWIAFESDRYGDLDLFVMRPDGSELTRVTEAEGKEQAPVWVPLAPAARP